MLVLCLGHSSNKILTSSKMILGEAHYKLPSHIRKIYGDCMHPGIHTGIRIGSISFEQRPFHLGVLNLVNLCRTYVCSLLWWPRTRWAAPGEKHWAPGNGPECHLMRRPLCAHQLCICSSQRALTGWPHSWACSSPT